MIWLIALFAFFVLTSLYVISYNIHAIAKRVVFMSDELQKSRWALDAIRKKLEKKQ